MNNSQFIKILKTLSTDEKKKFRKFLLSPYFNTNKILVKLFDHLTKKYKGYTNINENKVFQFIYPGKKVNKKRIRDLSSEMLGLCERFMAEETFSVQKNRIDLCTLNSYNRNNLKNGFLRKFNGSYNEISKSKINYEHYLDITSLDKEIFRFYNTWNYLDASKNADHIMNNTAKTISFEILRCAFAFEALAKVNQFTYDKKFSEELMKLIKRFDYFNDPVIKLYYALCLIHKNPGKDLFFSIKRQFEDIENRISDDIKKEVLTTLHNFLYTSQGQFSISEIRAESYDLLTYIFNNRLECDANGYIIINYFLNYSDLLIHYKKYNEVAELIERSKDRLGTFALKDDTINFTYAQLHYSKGEFSIALKYLDLISFKDKELYSFKKSFELNCYYELQDFMMIDKQIDSCKKYYIRNSDTRQFESFKPYIKAIEKLIKHYDNKRFLEEQLSQINGSAAFRHRKWLIDKLTERIREMGR